jgi:thiopeptide-type bacteriocin biosynthesis protein
VYVTERDLRLLLDLDAPVALDMLRDQLAAYGGELVRFEEMLPSFDELWLEDADGNRYVHEFVATVPGSVAPPRRTPRDLTTYDREQVPIGPGGAWTYVKLYGAEAELDALLRDHAGRIVAACAERADLDRWFFLRYRDPQHHLRLRLRAKDGDGVALVAHLCALLEPLITEGALRRYAFDTYEPELERYGGSAAQTAVQRLFRRDSERVLEALASAADAGGSARAALRSLAPFAAAWFRRVPPASWLDYHAAEARAEKGATDYTLVRELAEWLADAEAERDATDEAAIAELIALDAAGALTQPANAVFSAIAHMHFNRMGIAYDDEPAVRAHLWRAVYGRSVRPRAAAASGKAPVEAA